MIISTDEIANRLEKQGVGSEDPFVIAPMPDLNVIRKSGSASIDLRLGTWFVTSKARRYPVVDLSGESPPTSDRSGPQFSDSSLSGFSALQ